MHFPIVLCCGTQRALLTNKIINKIGAKSLNSTCLQSFVHVCIQVIELQELACRIVMCGPKLFFCGFPDVTQILLCLFSVCHRTLSPH